MFTLSGILRRANRNSKPNAPRRQARLRPEALEDRCVLSTLLVTSNADDFTAQPGTLRYAVENAASGDTISISRALTNTPIVLNPFLGELLINKDLAIEADANAPATIQAAAPLGLTGSRVFEITGGAHVTLSHLTLTNGHGSFGSFTAVVGGGAIYNAGILTVSDCTLSGNTADAFVAYPGGAILNSGGTITITHSTLSSNGGSRGGAAAQSQIIRAQ